MINLSSLFPRQIFLLDGLGALISTIMLCVLAYFEPVFGMPQKVLFTLIPITVAFSFYSLGCFALNPIKWKPFLTLIAMCNLLYCCLSIYFLIENIEKLTWLGIAYFVSEKFIVLALAVFELRYKR